MIMSIIERFKYQLDKIKQTVNETVESIRNSLKELYESAVEKFKLWQERLLNYIDKTKYKVSVWFSDNTYQMNPVDQELRDKCQEYVDINFPYGLCHELEQILEEDREEYLKGHVYSLASLMEVKVSNVVFFIPSNEEEMNTRGAYDREDGTVYINAAYIYYLDAPQYTEHVLITILHVLKHARQYAAIFDGIDYGYSRELLLEWALNMKYYITNEESDRAYRRQPIEKDAFGWSYTIDIHAEFI